MEGSIWQGKRIRLRAVEPSDWKSFVEWDLDSDTARGAFFIPFPRSEEAARRWAEQQAVQAPVNDNFRMVIEELDGKVVGTINTHSCEPRHGTFAYGIAVAKEYREKGYASEAITMVLRYFFRELRYQKATAHVYSFNEASMRLHESLGFKLEGRIRRMIYTGGEFYDDIIYGITVEEFGRGVTSGE